MNYDTHVCLVSAQATPNLIAAIDEQWRPRRVVLATSSEMGAAALVALAVIFATQFPAAHC